MSAFGATTRTLTGVGDPEQILGTRVSEGFFHVIGVEPIIGRSFMQQEYQPGSDQVVILGEAYWRRRFAGRREIIGQSITLDQKPYTVVGVMPEGIYPVWPTTSGRISFDTNEQQFWSPMSFSAEFAAYRSAHVLGVLGRLKPGVTLAQAQSEMNTVGDRLAREYPANKDEGILVNPFMNEMVGNVRPALLILLGAVGLVLLIACANIAGLLLAQYAARSKEIAIRAALGAARTRLMRQFFLEGLLISILGGVAGILLALVGTNAMLRFVPQQIPRLNQVEMDLPVLGFTLLLSLLTCFAFGLVPAWQASKPHLQKTLEQGSRTAGADPARQRLRRLLVVFQVSMTVMLVIGAGLLIKTFWRLRQVDPGFRPERVLSLTVSLPTSKYSEPFQINNFYSKLLARLESVPGVSSAGIAYDHPLQGNWIDGFTIEGQVESEATRRYSANFNPVSPDYFRTIGNEIVKGRQFTERDDQDHPGVAVVNESFARRYFPDEDAIGRRLKPSPPARIWDNQRLTSFEIVGIARDVKSAGLSAQAEPTYYLPASQAPLQDMTILVRSQSDPTSLVPSLRRAVLSVDPNQPIANISTMENIVADNIAQPKVNMILMGLFSVLALILAAVGIYGLLSYSVTQRRQEIGIRMALGAQLSDVLKLILSSGMALVLVGELIGFVGALALSRLMSGLLFGVTPTDTATYLSVFAVLTVIGLLACYLPARRATRVDPLEALRTE
jgi:putative ABC transport system permease protein